LKTEAAIIEMPAGFYFHNFFDNLKKPQLLIKLLYSSNSLLLLSGAIQFDSVAPQHRQRNIV